MPTNVMSTLVGMEIAVTSVERTDSRKTKDHEHREDEAQQTLLRERLDRLLDERRLVEDDAELGVAADVALQLRQERGDGAADVDGVGGGQLRDGDGERGLAVHARDRGHRVLRERHGGHVADLQGPFLAAPSNWAAEVGTSGRAAIWSTEVSLLPVCTVSVWSPSVTVPPGRARRSA
jgi:hypothetical protein